ncbi:MAG TPA: class I SAM-dependent methyltransferase [Bacteroidota bacterium]|nr:class I SAM-dependent methyltransferase [Bacteroidota bacterium]
MITCGICGGIDLTFLYSARDINFGTTAEEFSVMECPACGVVQTVPRPPEDSLAKYYPASYYPQTETEAREYERIIGRFQREKVKLMRRYRQTGMVLDVGCGAGYFVREASMAGYSAEGVEFSHQAVEFAKAHCKVHAVEGDVLEVSFGDRKFDIVTLWNVLEHLPHPAESIQKIHSLLKPGGILIAAVPNFCSFQARVFRDRWYHLEVPRHLYHFGPDSLAKLLRNQGFSILGLSHYSSENNWAGIMASMVPLVSPTGSLAGRALRKVFGQPLARVAAGLEALVGRGGTFTMIAQIP